MLCPQEEAGVGRGLVTEGLFSLFCALPQCKGMWVEEHLLISRLRLEDGVRASFPAALGEAVRLSHDALASHLSLLSSVRTAQTWAI